jgi:hypothetical protein
MEINDVLELIKENIIQEDAFNKEMILRKRSSSNEDKDVQNRVEKGWTEKKAYRGNKKNISGEARAINYNDRMLGGGVNSKGEKHEYTAGKINMGSYGSLKHLPVGKMRHQEFLNMKDQYIRGILTARQVKRSEKLSPEQKEDILKCERKEK